MTASNACIAARQSERDKMVCTLRQMIEREEAQDEGACIEWIDAWEMAIEAITKATSV